MNIFNECLKCQKDFNYFAETYLKVAHLRRGIIPLRLYDFQKRLIKEYHDNRFVVVKKFRQGGFTSMTALYALWQCMFHHNRKFIFLSKSDREAVSVGEIVSEVIAQLPEQLCLLLTHNSNHEKKFEITNSSISFTTPQACCSKVFTHLIIDEAAFIPDMENHWKSLYPTFGDNGKCFVVSTVNDIDNWFEGLYNGAANGHNSFKIFDVSYKEHPDYQDPKWEEQVRKNLGEKLWLQEIEGCFLGSTPTPLDLVRSKIRNIVDDYNLDQKGMRKRILQSLLEVE